MDLQSLLSPLKSEQSVSVRSNSRAATENRDIRATNADPVDQDSGLQVKRRVIEQQGQRRLAQAFDPIMEIGGRLAALRICGHQSDTLP